MCSLDTEEASESEYGRTGRNHDEPLEIKELWVLNDWKPLNEFKNW